MLTCSRLLHVLGKVPVIWLSLAISSFSCNTTREVQGVSTGSQTRFVGELQVQTLAVNHECHRKLSSSQHFGHLKLVLYQPKALQDSHPVVNNK